MANSARDAQLALQKQAEEYTSREQRLQREAVNYAAPCAAGEVALSTRVNQLEIALELQEIRNVQTLAQKERERAEKLARAWCVDNSPKHSSSGSANCHDGMSNSGSVSSQPGALASLASNLVNPFANTQLETHSETHLVNVWYPSRRTPCPRQARAVASHLRLGFSLMTYRTRRPSPLWGTPTN